MSGPKFLGLLTVPGRVMQQSWLWICSSIFWNSRQSCKISCTRRDSSALRSLSHFPLQGKHPTALCRAWSSLSAVFTSPVHVCSGTWYNLTHSCKKIWGKSALCQGNPQIFDPLQAETRTLPPWLFCFFCTPKPTCWPRPEPSLQCHPTASCGWTSSVGTKVFGNKGLMGRMKAQVWQHQALFSGETRQENQILYLLSLHITAPLPIPIMLAWKLSCTFTW